MNHLIMTRPAQCLGMPERQLRPLRRAEALWQNGPALRKRQCRVWRPVDTCGQGRIDSAQRRAAFCIRAPFWRPGWEARKGLPVSAPQVSRFANPSGLPPTFGDVAAVVSNDTVGAPMRSQTTPAPPAGERLALRTPISLRLTAAELHHARLLAAVCGCTVSALARRAYRAGLAHVAPPAPADAPTTTEASA